MRASFAYQVSSENVWDALHSLDDLFIWLHLHLRISRIHAERFLLYWTRFPVK
jgi:hypothetical protein